MDLLLNVLCLFVVFSITDIIVQSEVYYIPEVELNLKIKTTQDTVPWLGILRLKHEHVKGEFATIVTLIAKHYAIGCSDDISKIEKDILNTSTTVTFYNKLLVPWNTIMTEYWLHPEYGDETINTVALLHLDSENKVPSFMWQPVKWPTEFSNYGNQSSVFNIGFSDRRSTLEQVLSRVKPVNYQKCIDFYKKEGMDFKRIWPTNYKCFEVVDDDQPCVYDAGMALASNDTGQWTLIGLGTLGPGCSLPARFIEFFPYIPWVESIMESNKKYEEVAYRRSPWKIQNADDLDTKMLAILYNFTIDLYPNVPIDSIWNATNDCPNHRKIVYQELGRIRLTAPIPTATVFVSVSLFDDNFEDIQCIKVLTKCVQKSKTQVFLQRGFGQEDLEVMVQQPVFPTLGKDPSKDLQYPDKVLFLMGNYKDMMNKTVTTVWFKFIFFRTGQFRVIFFGKEKPITTSTTTEKPSNVTTTRAPITRRPHASYLKWDVYKDGQNG